MKFSEMSTKQAAQVMCDITVPLANIAQDEKTSAALASMGKMDVNNMSMVQQIGAIACRAIPILLKDHFEDTCRIIASMAGKTVEAVQSQTIIETVKDVKGLFDQDFASFFTSAGIAEQEK